MLADILPEAAPYADHIRVIDVPACRNGKLLEVIMDSEEGKALGFLQGKSVG
jgi:hypothetical protein